jgi:nucleotide-binding universal stress UspA family protein
VRVVIAMDLPMSMALAGVGAPLGMLPNAADLDAQDWAEKTARAVEQELRDAGLAATSAVREGDPKRVLMQEAEQWGADCIFVGAKGHSRLDRILLGSVSMAVAARAQCTVEVVRQG